MNENETKRHIIYLSGPITGNPAYKQQFALAEKLLRKRGYLVINPASLVLEEADSLPDAQAWVHYIRFDLELLETLQYKVLLYFLPGTARSKGSSIEFEFAKRCKIPHRNILNEYPNWFELLEEEYGDGTN